MVGEVVIVWQPFLFFSIAFDEGMAHNMLTLMLDPTCVECIKEYIRLERTKVVVKDYDTKVFIPMLMKVYHFLNLGQTFALVKHLVVTQWFFSWGSYFTWRNKWRFV